MMDAAEVVGIVVEGGQTDGHVLYVRDREERIRRDCCGGKDVSTWSNSQGPRDTVDRGVLCECFVVADNG